MLYYLQIQGRYAAGYYLGEKSQDFKSLLESMTNAPALVISSKYRTDIIFSSEEDCVKEVFKVWRFYTGRTSFDVNKFTLYLEREAILQHFFKSLVALSKMKDWYAKFLIEFKEICRADRNSPIAQDLLACESHLQKNEKTPNRPPVPKNQPKVSSQNLIKQLVQINSERPQN